MPTSQFIRRAFLANAAFSTLTATLMLLEGPPLAELMGLGSPLWLWALVPGLYAFAGLLVFQATRPIIWRRAALATCVADLGWVLGSAAALALAGSTLTVAGVELVVGVAGGVGLLGGLQLVGLARVHRSDGLPRTQ